MEVRGENEELSSGKEIQGWEEGLRDEEGEGGIRRWMEGRAAEGWWDKEVKRSGVWEEVLTNPWLY